MFGRIRNALRRLARAAENAVRRAVVWAPLLAAALGGAVPARAGSSAQLNINVTFSAIGSITDLTAVSGASTGTISLSWTEPYHSAGAAPYSYDVRASTTVQITDDTAFQTAAALSAFSTSVPPAPGSGGGSAGFVVSGLTPTVTYYFAIREKDSTTFHGSWLRNATDNVNNFAVATSTRPPAPAAAAVLSASGTTIAAAWTVSAGATDYVLVGSTLAANPPTLVAASSTTLSSTATLSGLGANTTYFLFVSACGGGCSAFTALGSTVTLAAPASSLVATAVTTGSVSLAWSANGNSSGTVYAIEISTDGVSFSTAAATTSTAATVGGLAANSTYYFEVIAANFAGAPAAPSNAVSAVTRLGIPPSPAGASIVAVAASAATVAWTLSAGATDYVLAASTSSASPPAVTASTTTTLSTGTLTGLGPNATYFFFVSACANGCSSFASAGSTITLAAPASGLTASAAAGTVSLSWSASGNPSGTVYAVGVSTNGASFTAVGTTTFTAVSLSGFAAGTTYYFEIVARNSAGTPSAPSNVATLVTTPAAPSAGAIVSVTASSATLSWTASEGAMDYLLVASTAPANPPSVVAASTVTALSTGALAGLSPNATYFFFAQACGNGCSAFTTLGSTMTLASPAVSLSTTAISSSTLTLAWSANGNPAGTIYAVQQSTDGVAYAPVGSAAAASFSLSGLTAGVTYDFEVVAFNGAGTPSAPSSALAVLMPTGPAPSTPSGLTASAALLGVSLTWTPLPAAQQGLGLRSYVLLRSANASAGYVQIATTTGASFLDRPLTPGATFFYKVLARDVGGNESAPSAAVFASPYTEPPMEPLGVQIVSSSSSVTLTWSATTRFLDGTPFLSTGTPSADELQGYSLYRSTDIGDPNYARVAVLPITATSVNDQNGGLPYYYRLYAFNSAGVSTNVVTLSSLGERNFMMDDGVSRIVVDPQSATTLSGSANGVGDIRIVGARRPQDVGASVFQSVAWHAYLNGATELKDYTLPKPLRVVLAFDVQNGVVVPSTAPVGAASARGVRSAGLGASNAKDLGVYWFNGVQYVKMYGKIDPVSQTVSVDSPNLGRYQIRALARAGGAVFDLSNLSSRVITPNGDGLNDTMIFTYDPGPNNVQPEGKILDLRGAFVSDMKPGLVPNTLTWDGRMNGRPVTSGVYVYRITGDGKTFTGSIVVAR